MMLKNGSYLAEWLIFVTRLLKGIKKIFSFRSRISKKKIREIVRRFLAGLTAPLAAELTGTNHSTINRIYLGLCQRIHFACED